MDSHAITLLTFIVLILGVMVGTALRPRLPEHHLRDESFEALQIALGILATLVALVLGLLVSSAKSSFDQASTEITQTGTTAILLDHALTNYGPEANPIRADLRRVVESIVRGLWHGSERDEPAGARPMLLPGHLPSLDAIQQQIRQLNPADDLQRSIRDHAVDQCDELIDTRWLIVEQAQNPLPPLFLALVIGWLGLLALGLGLLAPRNRTTLIAQFVCAVAMTGAVFLILELNQPFDGLIVVSPAPLENALRYLRR
jgi:hypothetical protein